MLSPGPVTFKATLPARPLPTLASHGLLEVEGPDAAAFLQSQLMNDVRTLAPGQWQWNGWLTAKGRLVALMALLRIAPDRFLAVLPDFPAGELQSRLQRYVFRSKVRLAVASHWRCAAQLQDVEAVDAPADTAVAVAEGWRLDMSGEGHRALWLLAEGSSLLAPADAAATDAWFALDLAHGLPRLPPEGIEAWTPQMLSLERLRAFSLAKGCYPGQEIVARTHYLGKAKRGLARIVGDGLHAGQSVVGEDGADVGQVACARADGREGLAVAALDRLHLPLAVAGRPVERLPLAEGLARPV